MFIVYTCFFFKQKTAYEMRISDWSSDVCSSDLPDLFACGGGVRNAFLMRRLAARLPKIHVRDTSALGVDPAWVEASAFAWLAWQTLHGRPGNLPAVTGASRAAILGGIYAR